MHIPKISIIVPVYNVEDYISQCIQSLIKQTYKNIEILLIDDGSTDNSRNICMEYAKKDCRIRYLYQENAGAAAARNKGLDVATGDYIGFVDSDDYIDYDMYELLLEEIQTYQADVAQILSRRVTNDGTILNKKFMEQTQNDSVKVFSGDDAIEHYLKGNHALWSHLYDINLFRTLRIPEGMLDEDRAVIIPLYRQCTRVVKIHKYKYNYRLNYESVTHGKLSNRRVNLLFEFERQLVIYQENQLYEELLLFVMFNALMSMLNDLVLDEADITILYDELFFKQKLLTYYHQFKQNRLVTTRQLQKVDLYLNVRWLYKSLLLLKRRFFYQKPAFGEE